MILDEILLEKLAEWRIGETRQILNVAGAEGAWGVALTADRTEEVACLAWEFTVSRPSPETPCEPKQIRSWADRIAARVTGLLETLKVVEVDAARRQALLRSETPAASGDDRLYYEVHLHGTYQATLRRYRGLRTGSSPRLQVPFSITHEALAKLTRDLTT